MLIPKMGRAGVISFREECKKEREIRNQDVLIVEKTKKEGVNLLATSIEQIPTVDWEKVEDSAELPVFDVSDSDGLDIETEENGVLNEEDIIPNFSIYKAGIAEAKSEIVRDIRVLIGKDKFDHKVFWEFGSRALANRHLLITGTSGQGKTYSIQTMLFELAKSNVSAVIFDYTEGFMVQQLEEPFKNYLGEKIEQHIVYSTGVPINPFQRQQVELIPGQLIMEKESDVAARLADIFAHVYEFGDQQYSAIFEAVYNGLVQYGDGMNMKHFREELEKIVDQNKTARSVMSKLMPFFRTVEFSSNPNFNWGDILYADEAKINIIQLTMFTQEMKVIITEMMLWDLVLILERMLLK